MSLIAYYMQGKRMNYFSTKSLFRTKPLRFGITRLAGLLLLVSVFPVSGVDKDPISAEAIVTMNDGTVLSGILTMIGANPLTMTPLKEGRQKQFRLEDILSIEHKVETADMKKPWVYKEAGSIEKVYYDEKEYPFINFITKITLVDGTSVSGHIVSAAFYLKDNTGKHKVFLQRQLKGDKGQTMAEVSYPVALQFPGNKAVNALPFKGTVEGLGKLEKVSAFDVERETLLAAKVSEGSKFDFGNLLPGTYDVFILTDTYALAGLSGDIPSNIKKNPLQDGDLEAIRKVLPRTDDFFKEKWVLKLEGSRDYAKTLAYKQRSDFLDGMGNPVRGVRIWHLEMMTWHLPETEWQLDNRFVLIRHKHQETEKVRRLFAVPSIGAVRPGTELKINKEIIDGDRGFIQDLK
ncbi:MAG: hypothetical protein A2X48_15645 [Lentisphaerae bacterium GWF2_49_21]|nr:MAG: hypothetical protein A2X48_15645 [Lentisphaerae bacterium GWF2_49_21]